jgi:hypothetical protein
VIERIQSQNGFRSLQAWGTSKWQDGDEKVSSQIALILQSPDRLRVEGFSLFGSSIYSLLIAGDEVSFLIPSERLLYREEASSQLMERFFSLPLEPGDVLDVFHGKVPLCSTRDGRLYREERLVVLEIDCMGNGSVQKVFLEPPSLDPQGFSLNDAQGKEVLRVKWTGFEKHDDVRVPTRILVEMPAKKRLLRLKMEEIEINSAIEEKAFQMKIPPGTQVRHDLFPPR